MAGSPQDDIGRAIAGIVAGWASLVGAADYKATWDQIGRGAEKARAMVSPGSVELADTEEALSGSARFQSLFTVSIHGMSRADALTMLGDTMRAARIAFNPGSRTVQNAAVALTSPSPSGKILGGFVWTDVQDARLTDEGTLAGREPSPQAPVLLIRIVARWAENLT